jgi:hypothetical protein
MKLYNQLKSEIIKNWQEMKKDRSLMLKNLSKGLFLFSAIAFIFNFGYFIFFLFSGLAINEKAKKFIIEKLNKKNFSNKKYIGIMLSIAFLGFIFSGDSDDANKNITKEANKNITKEKATASSSAKKQKTTSEKKLKPLSAKEATTVVLNSRDSNINHNIENLGVLLECSDTSSYAARAADKYYVGIYNGDTSKTRYSKSTKNFKFPAFDYNKSPDVLDANGFLKDYKSKIEIRTAPTFIFYSNSSKKHKGDWGQYLADVETTGTKYTFDVKIGGAGGEGSYLGIDDELTLNRTTGELRKYGAKKEGTRDGKKYTIIPDTVRYYQCSAISNDTNKKNIMEMLYDGTQNSSLKEYNSLKKSIEKGIKNRKF